MALTPVLLLLLAYCLSGVSSSAGPPPRSFTSLFALGDSYIDAGNFVTMATPVAPVWVDKPPYGMTFFERPTGRFSDGRVIVDFVGKISSMHGRAEALCAPRLFNSFNLSISRGAWRPVPPGFASQQLGRRRRARPRRELRRRRRDGGRRRLLREETAGAVQAAEQLAGRAAGLVRGTRAVPLQRHGGKYVCSSITHRSLLITSTCCAC
jgi:hypothetical protein